jgi:prevent-host-death family protein
MVKFEVPCSFDDFESSSPRLLLTLYPFSILDLVNYMVYYSTTMITINVQEAKTHFSHYLDEVAKGESFILCKRNKPVAEIRPIMSRIATKRPIGLAKGTFTIPASFFDELPEETISLFSGMTP